MATAFVQKLQHGADLSTADCILLENAAADVHEIGAHQDLISEGDRPVRVHLLVDGWAFRYKILPSGARQIMAYLIPGDFCDLHVAILGEMDHSIATFTPCTVAYIPARFVAELTTDYKEINRALWWSALVNEATLREWLVSMGGRNAAENFAHLLCELLTRLQSVGLASADSFILPLTQTDLGDTLGVSAIHVNRILQRLRADEYLTFEDKRITITDVGRLKKFANFNPNYLHLGRGQSGGQIPSPSSVPYPQPAPS